MAWCCGLEHILKRNVPLAARTTFGIGGKAAFLLEPSDETSFGRAYAAARASRLPVYVLGRGSNLLVADDGVSGVVLATSRLCDTAPSVKGGRLCVRAGTPFASVVNWAARAGLCGLECLAGIPGTVGGAVRVNAGGRHGSVDERVDCLWCVDEGGRLFALRGRDVAWGYRGTDIKYPVVAVEFLLDDGPPGRLLTQVAATLAEKHRDQPMELPSAGCFFRNPPADSAGHLIEMAGMKGQGVGAARVSETHANFIVNTGGATAEDVRLLCEKIRDRVREVFGVLLENEVRMWPESPALDQQAA